MNYQIFSQYVDSALNQYELSVIRNLNSMKNLEDMGVTYVNAIIIKAL